MNLSKLYYDFTQALKEDDFWARDCRRIILGKYEPVKERDPHRLYVTDLGKCHRQVAYRLLEMPKNPRAPETIYADGLMFDLAGYIEAMLAAMFMWQNKLVGYQMPVRIARDNWGGRTDIVADYDGVRVIEVKTVRSNQFNYGTELPKADNVYQLQAYHICEGADWETPVLAYFDRGGSNPAREFFIQVDKEQHLEIDLMMDELDDVRDTIKNSGPMPDKLPKVLQLRDKGQTIKLEPQWRCGYCDYSDICQPDTTKNLWARKDEMGNWSLTKKADSDILATWAREKAIDLGGT